VGVGVDVGSVPILCTQLGGHKSST
jgi:hypothetical protein